MKKILVALSEYSICLRTAILYEMLRMTRKYDTIQPDFAYPGGVGIDIRSGTDTNAVVSVDV